VRSDLIRGQSVAVFPFGTGSFTSESPYMSPFWPRKPEIFPVLAEVGNSYLNSNVNAGGVRELLARYRSYSVVGPSTGLTLR
jgi:hypothetical protein